MLIDSPKSVWKEKGNANCFENNLRTNSYILEPTRRQSFIDKRDMLYRYTWYTSNEVISDTLCIVWYIIVTLKDPIVLIEVLYNYAYDIIFKRSDVLEDIVRKSFIVWLKAIQMVFILSWALRFKNYNLFVV